VDNKQKVLNIVYGSLHGSIKDVQFPIVRGKKILIGDATEFERLVRMKPALELVTKLKGTEHEWILSKLKTLID
jgi:hypothetical protein